MLHRIEIYREPYSLVKDKTSEFKLNLLQTIESEHLSTVVDFGIDFMRSEFEFADLSADDITVGSFICSDPSGLDNSVLDELKTRLLRFLNQKEHEVTVAVRVVTD